MKVQNIILLVIVFVLLYVVIYYISKDASTVSSYIKSGTVTTTITPTSIQGDNGPASINFTYSVWFNVDDWNYKYGEPKIIFGRYTPNGGQVVPGSSSPTSTTASIPVQPPVKAVSANAASALKNSGSATDGNMITNAVDLLNYVTKEGFSSREGLKNMSIGNDGMIGDYIQQFSTPCPLVLLGPKKNNLYICIQCTGVSEPYIVEVSNVPIQRWVNLFMSVYERTLDIYLDGKLVKTGILPSTAQVDAKTNLYLTPLGGFNGWTSKLQYWDTPSDPQKAWNTYKAGYGSGLFNSLLGKYQVQISVLKDNQPTTSVTI